MKNLLLILLVFTCVLSQAQVNVSADPDKATHYNMYSFNKVETRTLIDGVFLKDVTASLKGEVVILDENVKFTIDRKNEKRIYSNYIKDVISIRGHSSDMESVKKPVQFTYQYSTSGPDYLGTIYILDDNSELITLVDGSIVHVEHVYHSDSDGNITVYSNYNNLKP